MSYKCLDNCCSIYIKPYKIEEKNEVFIEKKKAGVFFYDPDKDKVLIVQNKGNLWGIPKGTFENNENSIQCAIREVKEETGITLTKDAFENCKKFVIDDRVTYYFINMYENEVTVPENDVNGIGWVKVRCLIKLVKNNNLKFNYHAKLAFKNFLKINLL